MNRQAPVPGPPPETRYEVRQASFTGPLPPPHILAQYGEAVPNGADRVIAMAEQNAVHRRSLESQVVAGNIKAQARGQLFGFILGMTALLCGSGLIFAGKEAEGVTMVITAAGGLVGTFMWGRARQEKERREKLGAFPSAQPSPPQISARR